MWHIPTRRALTLRSDEERLYLLSSWAVLHLFSRDTKQTKPISTLFCSATISSASFSSSPVPLTSWWGAVLSQVRPIWGHKAEAGRTRTQHTNNRRGWQWIRTATIRHSLHCVGVSSVCVGVTMSVPNDEVNHSVSIRVYYLTSWWGTH